MLERADLEILRGYFPVDAHEFLQGRAYITESAITNRIEEVDPAWSLGIIGTTHRDNKIVVTATMAIKGVSRDGIGAADIRLSKDGDSEVNDAEKSAATDALKRCARLFGVGRYLLDLPKSVKDSNGLARWMNGNAAPTQQREPDDPEPVEDMVIRHVAKTTPKGKLYHVLTTRNHGNISIWSRELFKQAHWVDDMDWLEVDKVIDYANQPIPVMVQADSTSDGKYWEIVEVAQCEPTF